MAPAEVKLHLIVGSSCLGMLAVGANGTAIMAAIPTIRDDLGLDAAELEWAVNAYLIASAACIILGGKVADRAGARRVSLCGLLLFAAASVVIATAGSPMWLLAGRTLQGLGAAFAVPGTLAAVGTSSSSDRRASSIGAWAGFLMLGFSVGPLMGGALTHYLGWRAIFWFVALVMLVAAGGFLGAKSSDETAKANLSGAFDWVGCLLLAGVMIFSVLTLHGLGDVLRAPSAFAIPLAANGIALTLFVLAERRTREPFVDLAAFSSPTFRHALLVGSVAMFCILSFLLYFNLDAQSSNGLSMTAVGAGLCLLPMSAGLLVLALLAPRLVRRFGPRTVLSCAMMLIVIASAVIAASAAHRSFFPLLGGLFAIGVGLALPYATAPRLALSALPSGQSGQSSGIVNACTFLGGSMGVTGGGIAYALGGLPLVMALVAGAALVGVVVSWRMPGETRRRLARQPPDSPSNGETLREPNP
jgi:MFS family permease